MISWWNENNKNRCKKVHLLLQSKSEFTQRLMRHLQILKFKTWIDDSYKNSISFKNVDCVMMFASEINIITQVSFMKELLSNVKDYRVSTRKILLIWQLNKESRYHYFWIVDNWHTSQIIKIEFKIEWINFCLITRANT